MVRAFTQAWVSEFGDFVIHEVYYTILITITGYVILIVEIERVIPRSEVPTCDEI